MCDATLDLIAQMDDDWAARVQREKFQFHNAQWLEMIHSQRRQQQHHNGDGGGGGAQLFGNIHDDDDDVAGGGGAGGGGGHFFGGLDDLEELVRETEALEELDNSDDSFTIDGAGSLMAPTAATPGGGGRILDL